MSRNNNGKSPKIDLKLNLSRSMGGTSRGAAAADNNNARKSTSSSSPSSCLSSEAEQGGSNSPEATSMVLAACPQCLMYIMLAEGDLKCPKCCSPVVLDFLQDTTKKTRKTN